MSDKKAKKVRIRFPESRRARAFALSALLALCVCGAAAWGGVRSADRTLADRLYQQATPLDGQIVVVGITTEDLQRFGAWPWDREILAQTLEVLNADPETRPAAIGVDILFSGQTRPESDDALVRAASAGNVAVVCTAEFSSRVVQDGSTGYLDAFSMDALSMPFDALCEVAAVGHNNAMYDTDGVLRRHLWSISSEDGEIPSFPTELYRLYCSYWDLPDTFSPSLDSRGFWYVPYRALPGSYYEYSISDILDGNCDLAALSGSVVLIGPYDSGLSDDFITAADHAKRMYGVEYLANVLQAMLDGRSPREVSDFPQLLAVFLGLFLLGGCFLLWKLRLSIPLLAAAAVGAFVLDRWAFGRGFVLHPLWFPGGLLAIFLVSLGIHAAAAQRDRRRIRSTFARYVDASILHELLREDPDALQLGGRERQIAVLFVDLRGFTALSERAEPQQLVALLNEYLTLTSSCIRGSGGTLDKFIGDCTMAFWGAPLSSPDPVRQACEAAAAMAAQAKPLADRAKELFGQEVSFGIGIDYGPAIVGNVGASDRMDYTAIGNTVNLASRLESMAPAGEIYVSRSVAEALGGRAVLTRLGEDIAVRGRSEGQTIFRLERLLEPDESIAEKTSP